MMMVKGWGGDGYVRNVLFQNFTGRGAAHGISEYNQTA